jgi:hypothetical protein
MAKISTISAYCGPLKTCTDWGMRGNRQKQPPFWIAGRDKTENTLARCHNIFLVFYFFVLLFPLTFAIPKKI